MTNGEIFYIAYVAQLEEDGWMGSKPWNLLDAFEHRAYNAGAAALKGALDTPIGTDARNAPSSEPRARFS